METNENSLLSLLPSPPGHGHSSHLASVCVQGDGKIQFSPQFNSVTSGSACVDVQAAGDFSIYTRRTPGEKAAVSEAEGAHLSGQLGGLAA